MRPGSPWGRLHMLSFRETSCLQTVVQALRSKFHKLLLQHITFTPAHHLEAFSEYGGTEEAEGQVTSGEDIRCLGSTSPWEPKWQQVILE